MSKALEKPSNNDILIFLSNALKISPVIFGKAADVPPPFGETVMVVRDYDIVKKIYWFFLMP